MGDSNVRSVVVDTYKCIGTGACIRIYPEMFQLDREEEEYAVPQMEEGWDDDKLLEAAKACPVRAIILISTKQRQLYPS